MMEESYPGVRRSEVRPANPAPPSLGSAPSGSALTIDFIYTDTDQHLNEIAELYAYGEENDFAANRVAFEELMEDYGFPLKWAHCSPLQQQRSLERMAEGLEVADRFMRTRTIRAVLYLAQGNFADCLVIEEQPRFARRNIYQLYENGFFTTLIQLVHLEMESAVRLQREQNCDPNGSPTLNANVRLKLLINIIYLFIEEMLQESSETDPERYLKLHQRFLEEVTQPICGELLHLTLFDMVIAHGNSGQGSKFPTKKILLVLWKLLLLTLGGSDRLLELKNLYRERAGLKPLLDDTLEVTRKMCPASPPPTAIEMIEGSQHRKLNSKELAARKQDRPFKRQTVVKQPSFGEDGSVINSVEEALDELLLGEEAYLENGTEVTAGNGDTEPTGTRSPRSSSPVPEQMGSQKTELQDLRTNLLINNKSLPWAPKVRQKEIDAFFAQVRKKFIGYNLPDDRESTAGLPMPIVESIQILKKHLYESLADHQIQREEDFSKYPLTMKEFDEETMGSFVEQLYRTLLPNLPQYLIALLKLMLGAVSTLKSKNEPTSSQVLTEVTPGDAPTTVLQSLKLKIDLARHQEIVIKAISSILILLLKHYKINHVYQFEYICQQLMFANCIPLVIKFLSQEMCDYVGAKNTIPVLDFPACVIGEHPELTSDTLELLAETQPYCWRNLFASINLLRILNKLTKWKSCRVIMLVLFKASQPLKRALKVRHAMFQVYVLKLLKMQAKFLGRQWRKSNMKTMSAIYQKVRHRLNDDWAFANDVDTKSIYAQTEEFLLQAAINRFHFRRYEKPYPNAITSVTAQVLSQAGQISMKLDTASTGGSFSLQSPSTPGSISGSVFGFDSNQVQNSSISLAPGVSSALAGIAEADLLQPVDNNLLSVLARPLSLTKEFKQNYESWLEREVFQHRINWDQLLEQPIEEQGTSRTG